MPDGSVHLLISLIILVLFSGFFSGTETAFSCVNKIKLKTLSSNGNKRAGKVLSLAEENYDKLITTILVGNNIVNLSAATISTLFFTKIITGHTLDPSIVSTAVITIAVLIFGEITPKFIAKAYPERIAMICYPLIKILSYLFHPFTYIFSIWRKFISLFLKLNKEEVITEDEIITIVEEAQEDGTLKKEETKLIKSVIEFDDLEVENIITPRVNIVGIEKDTQMLDVMKVFQQTRFSRLPVYEKTIDSIVGTIHQSDFFTALFNNETSIKKIIKEPFFTTSHNKISKLLNQLQKQKNHMAIVLDEYGGTLGIVTMEDILEELVGEIWDEHDVEIDYCKQIDENTFVIDGNAPLDNILDLLNFSNEEKEKFEANTVSGWILEILGEIPFSGSQFKFRNLEIKILHSTIKKVLKVEIHINEADEKD